MDSDQTSYLTEFASTWGLLAGSLVIALPVIIWRIKDTVNLSEDLKFTDETLEEVAPTAESDRKEGVEMEPRENEEGGQDVSGHSQSEGKQDQ